MTRSHYLDGVPVAKPSHFPHNHDATLCSLLRTCKSLCVQLKFPRMRSWNVNKGHVTADARLTQHPTMHCVSFVVVVRFLYGLWLIDCGWFSSQIPLKLPARDLQFACAQILLDEATPSIVYAGMLSGLRRDFFTMSYSYLAYNVFWCSCVWNCFAIM